MGLIENKESIKRIKTYIEGFDEQLEGGIPEGYVCLMAGRSGSMKSTVSFNILYNAVKEGKNGIYISLEQSCTSLLNHLISMGFDLSAVNMIVLSDVTKIDKAIDAVKGSERGSLIVTDIGAIRKELGDIKSMSADADWLNAIKNMLKQLQEGGAINLFTLDSLSALYSLTRLENPRTELFHVFEFLRDLGLTAFLVAEVFEEGRFSEYGVEDYLSDGIFHLAMVREGRKVRRELRVVKLRATNATMDVFILDYKDQKFRALTKLPY